MKLNKLVEFEYTIEHESKLNCTLGFLVKAEVRFVDNYPEIESIKMYDGNQNEVFDLINFGWPYDIETIREEILSIALDRKRDQTKAMGWVA